MRNLEKKVNGQYEHTGLVNEMAILKIDGVNDMLWQLFHEVIKGGFVGFFTAALAQLGFDPLLGLFALGQEE